MKKLTKDEKTFIKYMLNEYRYKKALDSLNIWQLNDKYLESSKPIMVRHGKLVGYGKRED